MTRTSPGWRNEIARVKDMRPIHPAWVSHCIANAKTDDAIVVKDDRATAEQGRRLSGKTPEPLPFQRHIFAPDVFQDDLPGHAGTLPCVLLAIVEVGNEEVSVGRNEQVLAIVIEIRWPERERRVSASDSLRKVQMQTVT